MKAHIKTVFFALPGNERLTAKLAKILHAEVGDTLIRRFPDGETYLQIRSDVTHKRVVLVCTLHDPDHKFLPVYFLSKTAMELGAASVCLVAPYLAYMRQDKQFHQGEAVTSSYFSALIAQCSDSLITIDPHLHRRRSLAEIYPRAFRVMHAAYQISDWIKTNIDHPLVIGPDSESEQWVSEVAINAGAPFIILEKTRHGDRNVEVSAPQLQNYRDHTPVLVDDIISTARTMIETICHLKKAEMKPPVCIGIHAVFAGSAYQDLKAAGAAEVVTCNTIRHETNKIEIAGLLAEAYHQLFEH